jgi:hypothetical protein
VFVPEKKQVKEAGAKGGELQGVDNEGEVAHRLSRGAARGRGGRRGGGRARGGARRAQARRTPELTPPPQPPAGAACVKHPVSPALITTSPRLPSLAEGPLQALPWDEALVLHTPWR